MECSCIYVDAGDGPSCFKAVDRKARKEHTCCECQRIIQPFERYRYESGIWEGVPSAYKTCSDCISVRNEMFCEGYMFEDLWRQLREYVSDADGLVSTECLMSLTVPARDKVFALMDEAFMIDEET